MTQIFNKLTFFTKSLRVQSQRCSGVGRLGACVSLLCSLYWKSLTKNRGLENFQTALRRFKINLSNSIYQLVYGGYFCRRARTNLIQIKLEGKCYFPYKLRLACNRPNKGNKKLQTSVLLLSTTVDILQLMLLKKVHQFSR